MDVQSHFRLFASKIVIFHIVRQDYLQSGPRFTLLFIDITTIFHLCTTKTTLSDY